MIKNFEEWTCLFVFLVNDSHETFFIFSGPLEKAKPIRIENVHFIKDIFAAWRDFTKLLEDALLAVAKSVHDLISSVSVKDSDSNLDAVEIYVRYNT